MQEFNSIINDKVDVIIVSYNTGSLLFECINNVLLLENLGKIILVNNGNSLVDKVLINKITENNSKIKLISGHGNIGFAKACNMGSNIATSPFLFFLHPEYISLDVQILRKFIDSIKLDDYKVATCLILNSNNQIQETCRRNLLTPFIVFNESLAIHNLCNKFKKINLPIDEIDNLPNISAVPALSSTAIFTTKKYFQQIKCFDESYFCGIEDLDISMRIKINGDKIAFVKNITVQHLLCNEYNELSEVYKARGLIIYIQKFFPKFNNIILGSCLKLLIGLRYLINIYTIRNIKKNLR